MRLTPFDEGAQAGLAPDLVFDGTRGDFALAALDAAINPAGLRSEEALKTAVLICLMTDRRVDATELREGDRNRGWPGDSFDMRAGDHVLGSRLWLLRRRALTDETILAAEDYAREALQPLIDQGAFVRFDVAVTADKPRSRLEIAIAGYGRDGVQTFDDRFMILWDQIA